MKLTIDLGDWEEEVEEADPEFTNVESAYAEGADRGATVRQVSREYFIRQKQGRVEEDVFDPTGKTELGEGIYRRFLHKSPVRKYVRTNAAGEERVVGRYRGFPASDGDGITKAHSARGMQSTRNYLHNVIPGHIRRCFCLLAANGKDLKAEAEQLCAEIREMAQGLA